MLSEAFLLDADDHLEKASELSAEHTRLERAASELERLAQPRARLGELLEALRVPPPAPEELARFEAERVALGTERDRVFRLVEALGQLATELPALAWEDAERALRSSEQVAPALEEQHQRARAAVEAAEQRVAAAEVAWEAATAELQRADAELSAITAHAERLAQELASSSVPPDLTPERSAQQLAELRAAAERLTLEERDLLARRGAGAERVRQLGQDLAKIERELAAAQAAAEPATARWQALRAHAERALVLHSGESSGVVPSSFSRRN